MTLCVHVMSYKTRHYRIDTFCKFLDYRTKFRNVYCLVYLFEGAYKKLCNSCVNDIIGYRTSRHFEWSEIWTYFDKIIRRFHYVDHRGHRWWNSTGDDSKEKRNEITYAQRWLRFLVISDRVIKSRFNACEDIPHPVSGNWKIPGNIDRLKEREKKRKKESERKEKPQISPSTARANVLLMNPLIALIVLINDSSNEPTSLPWSISCFFFVVLGNYICVNGHRRDSIESRDSIL